LTKNEKINLYRVAWLCGFYSERVLNRTASNCPTGKKILEQKKLLVSPECTDYLYIPDNEPGIDVVSVVEKHGGNCPGDPQVQHRLFSVSVDKKTHKMESDIDMDDQVNGTRSAFPPKN
jgi:hypothetical protein